VTGSESGVRPGNASRDRPSRYDYSNVRLTFRSDGERCVGRLYRPDRPSNPPLVVLAGGPIAVGGRSLAPYAERLAAAGYAAFTFDFRHTGDSDGDPRNLVSPTRQRADWEAALAGLRGRGDVATDHTVLWGVGLAADGALAVAADDPRIAGVVAGAPILSGRAFLRDRGLGFLTGGLLAGARDRILSVVGRSYDVPVAAGAPDGDGGRYALVSTPNASRAYRDLAGDGWENRTPARSILALWRHTGSDERSRPSCPVLVVGGTRDDVAGIEAAEAAAASLPDATLVRLPAGHFDFYDGDGFDRCVRHGIAFLDATTSR
jgi:pimeloyl-ACP methyl ester carboxylesterase